MRLGKCDSCGCVSMVNVATHKGKRIGEFCAKCFDNIDCDSATQSKEKGECGGGQRVIRSSKPQS